MVREDLKVGENNLVVTAHPDDEVLWGSGIILRNKEKKWTILCCSIPRIDDIRAYKFFDSCEVLGAKPRLLPIIGAVATFTMTRKPIEPEWAGHR